MIFRLMLSGAPGSDEVFNELYVWFPYLVPFHLHKVIAEPEQREGKYRGQVAYPGTLWGNHKVKYF